LGKCPACNEWDTITSRIQSNSASTKNAAAAFAPFEGSEA
jgi:predicted ATP-dependent serine protease